MASQIGPENRKVSSLVYFHSQIEEQGTVAAISMQEDYRWTSLSTAKQPTPGQGAVAVSPGFVSYF